MGVRGLTTFIKAQENKYLKKHKLHGCQVLLDGYSIATNLFIWSNVESAFGGDYDKFAKYVKDFFKTLKKCEISPLVVFDGGYEQRKLKTVYSRMKDKVKSIKSAHPVSGSVNFPLFMRIVFREVLVELDIPFAQSDFEADDELASLARQLNCPIISYDSDFFIYDVLYIPFPSLNLEPLALNETNYGRKNESCYYLECKIYSVDYLTDSFGGLDRTMLPLLATVLGNDYIKRSVFKAFYTNLKIPKGKSHPLQRRIKAVVEWLRNETFESAVKKILGRMKKNARRRVSRQLKQTVNGYVKCNSILNTYLGLASDTVMTCSTAETRSLGNSNIINIIEHIDTNIDLIELTDELNADLDDVDECCSDETSQSSDVNDCSSVEDLSSEEQETHQDSTNFERTDINPLQYENESHLNTTNLESKGQLISFGNSCEKMGEKNCKIPDWLLDLARRGKIQSCVIDIISLGQYFSHSQVEDISLPPSHFISFNILSAIFGLLSRESDRNVKVWSRKGIRSHIYKVEPITGTAGLQFPSCDKILQLTESERKSILLEVAGNTTELYLIPEDWHIFLISAVYWLRKMEMPVATETHLHTIAMCLVGMITVDSKIGIHRNKQTFTRKYRTCMARVKESRINEKDKIKETFKDRKTSEPENPVEELKKVSFEDCVLAFETILPYHHLSEEIKVKPKTFCLTTVHAFSQLQSCLFHLMVLNSILGFPLKEFQIYRFFSGTFYYNIFTNFSKRNNLNAYVQTFFQKTPTLLNLYKSLICVLEKSLNGVYLEKTSVKSRKKRKKICQQEKYDKCLLDGDEEEEEEFFDGNNKFSKLLKI